MLEPTRRRNGRVLVTVRITHHLGLDEFIGVMVLNFWRLEDPPAKVSKGAFEEALRGRVRMQGWEKLTYWSDDFSDDEAHEAEEWAKALLRKMYPSMFEGKARAGDHG